MGIRNTRLLAQLNGVLKAFREAGIEVVVLKGAHLAELVYEEVALRPMADVDLLVRPAGLHDATRLLRSLGYEQATAGPAAAPRHQEAIRENMEVDPFRKPGGLLLDLHYAIAVPAQMADADLDGVWSRVQEARIGGAQALVLSPEDLAAAPVHSRGADQWVRHHPPAPERHSGGPGALRGSDGLVGVLVAGGAVGGDAGRPGHPGRWRSGSWAGPVLGQASGAHPYPLPPSTSWRSPRSSSSARRTPLSGSANLPALWGEAGLAEKGLLVLRRTFPSRAEMGFMYGVPARSWRVPMLYPLRLGQLLARYAAPVTRVLRGHEASTVSLDVERERRRLVDWMGER